MADALIDPDDFPALLEPMNGQRLAYLDSAASAQKPRAVIDAESRAMESGYANVHRGLYALSQERTRAFEEARAKIAAFIGAGPEGLIFTRSATEAVNLVAGSWGRSALVEGDEIILTGMEHHANIVPWTMLKDALGIRIRVLPVTADGDLGLAALPALLNERTRMIGMVHVSNALGRINPVADIAAKARAFNPEIRILIDGAQAAVHMPVNVRDLDCDFYAVTGHKLYGPTGIGALYVRPQLLDGMPPWQGGGDMIETVSFEEVAYKTGPARFEAGTPPIVQALALDAAVDYVSGIGMEAVARHEQALLEAATEALGGIGGVRIFAEEGPRASILSFVIEGAHISDVALILDQAGVAVRAGHHCCMPLMKALGVEGTLRASFGIYNTADDIDQLADALRTARRLLE